MPGNVIARELVPLGGGGLGGTLQQCAWPEALQSFLFALQWTILAMFSTNVTIFHHLISQAGWNRCNLSIYLSTRSRTGVPRSQRLCPLCQSPYSEERHTLLECTALSPLREKYQQLFCPHVSMRQFMWQNDLPQLARFVIERLQVWQPHNPPASEVVKCRALSGCCVATNLVACPGTSLPGN